MTAVVVQALASLVCIELDDRAPATVADAWIDARVSDRSAIDSQSTAEAEGGAASAEPLVIKATTPDAPGDGFGDGLASKVTLAAIEALRGRALMFHACAVALPDGRVVGFVGPSGRGKTTLARTLGQHYGYVTDETLAVMPGGDVLPYRKPLSIGRRPGVKQTIAPSALGLQPLTDATLRLAAIVLLDRREDGAAPVVSTVPLAEAMAELASDISSLGALPSPLRTLADALQRTGGVRRLTYGDIDHLTDPIADILAATAVAEPYEVLAVGSLEEQAGDTDQPGSEGYRRAAAQDALAVGDHILVYAGDRLTLLTELGSVLWRAADGVDVEVLRARAREDMPPPPDGVDTDRVLTQSIEALVEGGLLTRD